jgi:hypothetical protein
VQDTSLGIFTPHGLKRDIKEPYQVEELGPILALMMPIARYVFWLAFTFNKLLYKSAVVVSFLSASV